MNRIVEAFVLPRDIEILAVADLDDATRALLNADADAYTISRPLGRATAKIVDADTAALLRHFQTPVEIVHAIARSAIARGVDPHAMLESAFPTIERLIYDGFLVPAADSAAEEIVPRLQPRARVGEWTVQQCVRALEDVEIYEVRDTQDRRFALKVSRTRGPRAASTFAHEARMLRRIGPDLAPALEGTGVIEGFPYLVMQWRRGLDAARMGHELRHGPDARRRLGALGSAIADAYAALHARGVIHGDVHDANVLVDAGNHITLLDFALARRSDTAPRARDAHRGGFPLYFEPEYASAALAGRPRPVATRFSDQYALGAMLYRVITGTHYLDFAMQSETAWRQIAHEPPRTFAACGVEPWPAVEQVLQRALAKSPDERFAGVAEFAVALQAACAEHARPRRRRRIARQNDPGRFLGRFLPGGDYYAQQVPRAPRHSLAYGSAGIAYALYRWAVLQRNAAALAAADVWLSRAQADVRAPAAFYDGSELTRATIGRSSLFYGPTGVAAVAAAIGHAAGDWHRVSNAVHDWLTIRRPSDFDDLTIGRAGKLFGCAMLLDAIPGDALVRTGALRRRARRLANDISRRLEKEPAIGSGAGLANLGVAHGWAGMLYALLRWSASSGDPVRQDVARRLNELADCAESVGRGVRWPWRDDWRSDAGPLKSMAGWCNGSAGFVHLWLSAHAQLGEERYLELARAAAWNAWEYEDDQAFDLCCGWAGRAYALLALYRHSGEGAWVGRARDLYERAAAVAFSDGDWAALYKGALGVALLGAELEVPYAARMPFFEAEGWPRSA
jgi:eukaryotic-like serine/threonine-protein kinase